MSLNALNDKNALKDEHDLNIDPTVWGPHLWATIHTLALKADSDLESLAYGNFLNSLHFLLPCNACKHDFSKYVSAHGYPNIGNAFEWSVNFHNNVNRKLGKNIFTTEEARSQWFSDSCSYSCKTQTKKFDYGPLLVLVVFLVVISFRYVRYS